LKIQVLYFSQVRGLADGRSEETVDINEGATAGELLSQVKALHPQLEALEKSLLIAVNEQWAPRDRGLTPGDVVALMPPVSGG